MFSFILVSSTLHNLMASSTRLSSDIMQAAWHCHAQQITVHSGHEQTNYIWGVIISPTRFASEHFLQWKQDAILDTFRFVPSVYTHPCSSSMAKWKHRHTANLNASHTHLNTASWESVTLAKHLHATLASCCCTDPRKQKSEVTLANVS